MASTSIHSQTAADHSLASGGAEPRRLRILLAKVGLDGHDRGIKVVARGLRDAGHHVIYGGIWQSPEAVAQAALDEDVDWLGLSMLSGAHQTLVPRVLDALRDVGADDVQLMLGGIIPADDVPALRELGVAAVFGPGTSMDAIDTFLRQAAAEARPRDGEDLLQLERLAASGDRAALARLLSCLSCLKEGRPVPARRTIHTVAVTGSGGVGKSSLIAQLAADLSEQGKRVAVLACDPQSPLSGGALLGDRIRMASAAADRHTLFRSLPVLSGQQGVSPALGAMIAALQAFHFDDDAEPGQQAASGEHGFDVVLIESAGAGQGDVAVRQFADCVILLLQGDTGDGVQWEKAGLLEVADLIVAHKSDLPSAQRLRQELSQHLNVPGFRDVPVLAVSAMTGEGVAALGRYVANPPISTTSPTDASNLETYDDQLEEDPGADRF